MDILVISACSGAKAHDSVVGEGIDEYSRAELVERYPEASEPAARQYEGNEHQDVKRAVETFSGIADVDWKIISAGFGVLDAEAEIPSYECSLNDSIAPRAEKLGYGDETKAERAIGQSLRIPQDLKKLFENGYDYVFVLLGESYLQATCDALETIPNDSTAFAFTTEYIADRVGVGRCHRIPATGNEGVQLDENDRFLKGRQLRELAERVDSAAQLEGFGHEELTQIAKGTWNGGS